MHVAAGSRQARYLPGGLVVGRPMGVFLEALEGVASVQFPGGALEPAFDAVLVVGAAEVVDELGEVVSARSRVLGGVREPVA